jgi:hypothetical protein
MTACSKFGLTCDEAVLLAGCVAAAVPWVDVPLPLMALMMLSPPGPPAMFPLGIPPVGPPAWLLVDPLGAPWLALYDPLGTPWLALADELALL